MQTTKGWDDLSELENNYVPELIHHKDKNNLLIVDGTNVAFRYLNRPIYAEYEEDYLRTVESLADSYSANRVIVCFDISSSGYRKEIHPEYKANRKVERTEEEQEKFNRFFNCLHRISDNIPFESYKFKGIEADDLICYISDNLSNEYDHTWIVSSDKDLYQLLSPTTSIFNLFGKGDKREVTMEFLQQELEMTPEEFLMAKIIQGDKSDNIAGIAGVGAVRSKKFVKEYGTLDKLIKALPLSGRSQYISNLNKGKDKLILNEKLISLSKYNNDAINKADNPEEVRQALGEL